MRTTPIIILTTRKTKKLSKQAIEFMMVVYFSNCLSLLKEQTSTTIETFTTNRVKRDRERENLYQECVFISEYVLCWSSYCFYDCNVRII